jgi:hypothetical protein
MTEKEQVVEQQDPAVEMTAEQPGAELSEMDAKTELERTRKALAKANQEAAERRVKLAEYEAAEQKRKEAEMTELEKARAAVDKAEAERQAALQQASAMVLRSTIVAQAAALGFADPEDAYKMLDTSDLSVEDGKAPGVEDALKSLAEAKPYLLRVEKKTPPQLNPANPGGGNANAESDNERRRRLGLV